MSIIDSKTYVRQIDELASLLPEKNISVLVTGATGLIGSCIADVFIYANRNYGHRNRIVISGRNADKLNERFAYARGDRLSTLIYDVVNPLCINGNIDYIVHAASNADPMMYSLYPAETILTNIMGINSILEYCKEHKNTRLLFTSSFEVYGKIDDQDIYTEKDYGKIDMNRIRSCYPESKRCAEILLKSFYQEYGVNGVVARLCSIYGPTMSVNDSKAHAQFIRNGIAGEDIVLKSRGEQKRTYAYLIDAVSGLLSIMFKGDSGEVYNVSYEKSVASIAEVALAVAKLCGTNVVYDVPSSIEAAGYSTPQNCILDNRKLKGLGWEGQYSLRDGLNSTIKILKEMQSYS